MTGAISDFEKHLWGEEKCKSTVDKYVRDAGAFCMALHNRPLTKEFVIKYKAALCEKFKPAGVNSRLVAINRFLQFTGRQDCCVKLLKIQRQMFANEKRELTAAEYKRLVNAAGNSRISFVLQTICGTGIRVSELQYITAEAVEDGRAVVSCKNKTRIIFIPVQLQRILKNYIKKAGIKSGCVFVTNGGKPLNRSNIWREMKMLCRKAHVNPDKVFPHNLRHLFARTFYQLEKDIVRLADLLGHSNVETTRIYTIETGVRHREGLNAVGQILFTT